MEMGFADNRLNQIQAPVDRLAEKLLLAGLLPLQNEGSDFGFVEDQGSPAVRVMQTSP
jgi:hypothetical protein